MHRNGSTVSRGGVRKKDLSQSGVTVWGTLSFNLPSKWPKTKIISFAFYNQVERSSLLPASQKTKKKEKKKKKEPLPYSRYPQHLLLMPSKGFFNSRRCFRRMEQRKHALKSGNPGMSSWPVVCSYKPSSLTVSAIQTGAVTYVPLAANVNTHWVIPGDTMTQWTAPQHFSHQVI